MFEVKNLKITSEMLVIIKEIDEFKGAWSNEKKLTPEKFLSLKKVATIESIGSSNRIEGNKLTNLEVESLLSNINTTSFASRDEEEVAGYANLMETIFDNWSVIPFTENYIKQMHKILLQYSLKDEKHRGEYKKLSNSVAAYDFDGNQLGIIFETASPFETPQLMEHLINWTRNRIDDSSLHPLLVVGIFIVNFLAIHPFQDGNGRISRAITALLLLKSGYDYVPYCSIESIIEDNKEGYYRALRQTQSNLNNDDGYESWLMFFLRTMLKHKISLAEKLNEYSSYLMELPMLSSEIMELIELKKRINLSEVIKQTAANPNTVKKHLSSLVAKGYIVKHGVTKGVWYTINDSKFVKM